MDRKAHWEHVYRTRQPDKLSWSQAHPDGSVLINRYATGPDSAIIDIGGGDSHLPPRISLAPLPGSGAVSDSRVRHC